MPTQAYRYKDVRPSNADGLTGDALIEKLALGIEAMATKYAKLDDAYTVLSNDVNGLRRTNGLAPAGAGNAPGVADVEQLGAFVKACAGRKLGMPEMAKAADIWTITEDTRGGYTVPITVQATIDAALRPYGSLLDRCRYTTVEPGRTHRIPAFSSAPVAAWQMTEGGALTELDVAISALDRKPHACGGYLDMSYQLLHQSAHDVGQSITTEVLAANRQAIETALVVGDEGVDAPYDGLLEIGGTHGQTTLATPTSALVSKFIGETLTDNPSMWDRGVLVMSAEVAETLAANEGTSSYRGRVEVDGNGGMRFGRWPLVVTPAAGMSLLMIDPAHVHVVNYGSTVLLDDKSGIKNLLVTLAIVNWFGYGVSLPGSISKAEITALS